MRVDEDARAEGSIKFDVELMTRGGAYAWCLSAAEECTEFAGPLGNGLNAKDLRLVSDRLIHEEPGNEQMEAGFS